jgi:Meiotically up-regulated gene 113
MVAALAVDAELMAVYFVKAEKIGLVKIGVAKNVRARLSELQVGSPDRLLLLGFIQGDEATERRLHALFREKHVIGEWFALDAEDLADIEMVTLPPAQSRPRIFRTGSNLNVITAIVERDELLVERDGLLKQLKYALSIIEDCERSFQLYIDDLRRWLDFATEERHQLEMMLSAPSAAPSDVIYLPDQTPDRLAAAQERIAALLTDQRPNGAGTVTASIEADPPRSAWARFLAWRRG